MVKIVVSNIHGPLHQPVLFWEVFGSWLYVRSRSSVGPSKHTGLFKLNSKRVSLSYLRIALKNVCGALEVALALKSQSHF